MRWVRRRHQPAKSPRAERIGAGTPEVPETGDPARVHDWVAFWDADSQHVAATGEHLGTVMWSDDGAVGVRGWYY